MGKRGKLVKGVPQNLGANHVDEISSDSSDGAPPHNPHIVNPCIWADPFDLGNLGPNIRKQLSMRAPFLLGDNAVYNVHFFHEVGGLSMRGVPFKRLKEENGIPLEQIVGTYPLNRSENRHPLRHMDEETAARALRMYQRVYGGTVPDNGEFGTAFVRGLMLEAKKWKINWADGAAELAKVINTLPL